MKKMNTILALVLCMALALPAVACAQSVTYTGVAQGFGGDVTAYVTVDEAGKIEAVSVSGPNETIGKGSLAIEQLPEKIVEANGTQVDALSGVTVTSEAICKAVEAALSEKVEAEAPAKAEIAYKAGVYTGKGFGFASYVTVETEFSDDAIVSVKVVDNNAETPYLRDLCAEKIPAQIVANQSLNVDVVTGATWGSNAIINAVAQCVEQAANADVAAALKAVAPVKMTGEDAVYEGYDLAVVGGGGSGLIAASVAAKAGLKVIVIEAADRLGGVSEIAGGGTLAIGTKIQQNSAQKDSSVVNLYEQNGTTVEEVYKDMFQQYLDSCSYQCNALLVKRYLDTTAHAADFMAEEMGMPYTARSITAVNYGTKGMRYQPVGEQLEKMGNTILLATRGERLIMNEDGSVGGVIAVNQDTGAQVTVYAKSVLLATGGMSANNQMQEEYAIDYNDFYMNWGGSTANGDGAKMAWEIGAALGSVGTQSHNEGLPTEFHDLFDFDITTGNCLYANLVYEPMLRVDHITGRRISDETIMYTPHYQGNRGMVSQGAVVLVDQKTIDDLMENGSKTRPWRSKLYVDPMKNPDYTGMNLQEQLDMVIAANTPYAFKADTIEELAGMIDVDAAVLQKEIDKYNTAVETGVDEEYGRAADTMVYTVAEGPFYALYTKVRNLGTWGGIETDETLAVYHENGRVIPGLYAAGLDALGWIGTSYFVDTTTLGWMTASGYMAGESIVEYIGAK